MLERVLEYLKNYFVKEVITGDFEISSGTLDLPFLQDDQYFKIEGSVFNDGVHKYPADDLIDESFSGEIWAMAVPPSVVALAQEIGDWCSANPLANSPFTSESFSGYSYVKSSNSKSGGPIDWQDVFHSRLVQWRKV